MLIGLLPVSGLARFMFQIHSTVADHYMYLPMLGPAMALAWLIDRYGNPPAVADRQSPAGCVSSRCFRSCSLELAQQHRPVQSRD
jgi:hypothetical protein